MKNVYAEIRKNYKVDGENEKYATLYQSKDQIEEEYDVKLFEEQFDVHIDELNFPIITFDSSGAVDGWLFEADADKDYILDTASDYFDKK